jgi:ATP/maltotriose-dependent transcriptional regulator MalT
MEGRQEGVEPLDRAYGLSFLNGEVEAVGRGDRSMQQCRARPLATASAEELARLGEQVERRLGRRAAGELEHAGLSRRELEVLRLVSAAGRAGQLSTPWGRPAAE